MYIYVNTIYKYGFQEIRFGKLTGFEFINIIDGSPWLQICRFWWRILESDFKFTIQMDQFVGISKPKRLIQTYWLPDGFERKKRLRAIYQFTIANDANDGRKGRNNWRRNWQNNQYIFGICFLTNIKKEITLKWIMLIQYIFIMNRLDAICHNYHE